MFSFSGTLGKALGSTAFLATVAIGWTDASAQVPQELRLRQSVDIEAERLETHDGFCASSTNFTCRDGRFYVFGWEGRWPEESGSCPTFALSKRVALEWQVGPDVIPSTAVILDVAVEFDIRIPAEYGLNEFEIHGHPNRLPKNEWEMGGDSPCQSIWTRVAASPLYVTANGWNQAGKKVVSLGDGARNDLQNRVLSPSANDDYMTIGIRSTQEGSYPPAGPYCVVVTQGNSVTVDCSEFVQLFGPQTLIVTYLGAESPHARGPAATTRLHSAPNPFRSSTTLEYTLLSSGGVDLAVFDVTGARVRTLIDGDVTAGTHQAIWDGHDQRGKRVASGVYFYRLEGPSGRAGGKLFLRRE